MQLATINNLEIAIYSQTAYGVTKPKKGDLLPYLDVKMASRRVKGLIDTGAGASLISVGLVKRLGLTSRVKSTNSFSLSGILGDARLPTGEIEITFFMNKRRFTHKFFVASLATNSELILGQDLWKKHHSFYANNFGHIRF